MDDIAAPRLRILTAIANYPPRAGRMGVAAVDADHRNRLEPEAMLTALNTLRPRIRCVEHAASGLIWPGLRQCLFERSLPAAKQQRPGPEEKP